MQPTLTPITDYLIFRYESLHSPTIQNSADEIRAGNQEQKLSGPHFIPSPYQFSVYHKYWKANLTVSLPEGFVQSWRPLPVGA